MHEQTWNEPKHSSRTRQHATEEYLRHHRLVLQAVRQRDTRRARQVMAMHMSAVETALLAELEHRSADGLILTAEDGRDEESTQ